MKYFKRKHFKKDIVLVTVGHYFRVSLSYRDAPKIMRERGTTVHPTTIML
ncbi:hypothetical protein ICM_05685 [Bacillus cereus BAG1X2-3]|nr:hypothetical protein ICC_06151 [Bacillus cereus BAG1X1-1]EOO42886.1 hypothetical protein ICI_06262 [Bacillus cereus BAG1X2-1]EOO56390.1 hypothetical protein ICM_05685 [Bacillus cereus BAG1X2-3]EOP00090.1 hypothetical protein ICO_06517 [Bacillus cereus BAG2O-1]